MLYLRSIYIVCCTIHAWLHVKFHIFGMIPYLGGLSQPPSRKLPESVRSHTLPKTNVICHLENGPKPKRKVITLPETNIAPENQWLED